MIIFLREGRVGGDANLVPGVVDGSLLAMLRRQVVAVDNVLLYTQSQVKNDLCTYIKHEIKMVPPCGAR